MTDWITPPFETENLFLKLNRSAKLDSSSARSTVGTNSSLELNDFSTSQIRETYRKIFDNQALVSETVLEKGIPLAEWEESLDRRLEIEQLMLNEGRRPMDSIVLGHNGAIHDLLAAIGYQAGVMLPGTDQWNWQASKAGILKTGQLGDLPISDTREAWNQIRTWDNPGNRRALFWLAACAEGHGDKNLCGNPLIFVPHFTLDRFVSKGDRDSEPKRHQFRKRR